MRDVKYPQNDPANSREYKAGDVVECDADHANRWIRRNAAVEVAKAAKKADEPPAFEVLKVTEVKEVPAKELAKPKSDK